MLIANAALVDATDPNEHVGEDTVRIAASRASSATASSDNLVEREHELAERLITIVILVANLRHAMARMHFLHVANGVVQLNDMCELLRRRIGRLNAAWLWGKRTDATGALAEAHAALRALGEHHGVLLFLRDAAQLESDTVRVAALRLAALFESTLEVS